jgi:hypothetical protein
MYGELASSLRHIADAVGTQINFNKRKLGLLCDRLDDGIAPDPIAFSKYYLLVNALMTDDLRRATTLLDEITKISGMPERSVVALGQDLDEDHSALYASMIEEDEPARLDVVPPSPAAISAFQPVFAEATELIEAATPAMADEIEGLARQIILVGQGSGRESMFDGGSHFQIWNALFLNIDRPRSRIAMAEVIVHECAHSLLFGFCIDETLTSNRDDNLYSSPLREDLRPVDGIYHAAFVSARMYWLMAQLMESSLLNEKEMAEAARSLERDRRNFEEGYSVVAEHGLLTKTGKGLMAGARSFMDAAHARRQEQPSWSPKVAS